MTALAFAFRLSVLIAQTSVQ